MPSIRLKSNQGKAHPSLPPPAEAHAVFYPEHDEFHHAVEAQASANESYYALDPFRLRFRNPTVESEFSYETFTHSIGFIRAYLIAGSGLFVSFGVLDRVVGGNMVWSMLAIRYALVCPILLAVFASTFTVNFYRVGQLALSIAMASSGLGIVAMTAIMEPEAASRYYAGLIMCVIYCGSLIRLKFIYSMMISVFLCLSYQVSAVILNPIPITQYISNNFFLVMATQVGLFSGYIQEIYIRKSYVQKKIIEAKNKVMNQLLAEAYSANRSKSEFLANMSHELRTPLNAIIGFSEIFAKQIIGPLGSAKYVEYANDIHSSGIHLLSIINDILDLAKAESGKLDLSEDEVDLVKVIRRSMRMCEHRALQRRLTITVAPEHEIVRVIADEKLLLQLSLNLLSNAVKFTPDGGEIRISVTANTENGVEIAVIDTGIGIPPEDLERVLRPFEQIESTYTRKFKGTGLGLPYAVRVTELHGGKLTIESTVGKGTTVRVWLPPSRFVAVDDEASANERKAI